MLTEYMPAGDMRRGQSLVVWAIHEGREAAIEVDAKLLGYSNLKLTIDGDGKIKANEKRLL